MAGHHFRQGFRRRSVSYGGQDGLAGHLFRLARFELAPAVAEAMTGTAWQAPLEER